LGSSLLAGQLAELWKSPQATQTVRSEQYALVCPYSWKFLHCTGPFISCGSSTLILRFHKYCRL